MKSKRKKTKLVPVNHYLVYDKGQAWMTDKTAAEFVRYFTNLRRNVVSK